MDDEAELHINLPRSHPYLATLTLDPADLIEFERFSQDRSEVRIGEIDQTQPDTWAFFVACTSETVRDRLEEAW